MEAGHVTAVLTSDWSGGRARHRRHARPPRPLLAGAAGGGGVGGAGAPRLPRHQPPGHHHREEPDSLNTEYLLCI